jgi:hypothetical protein
MTIFLYLRAQNALSLISVNFNIPEAFSAVANAKKSLEKCGGVLYQSTTT